MAVPWILCYNVYRPAAWDVIGSSWSTGHVPNEFQMTSVPSLVRSTRRRDGSIRGRAASGRPCCEWQTVLLEGGCLAPQIGQASANRWVTALVCALACTGFNTLVASIWGWVMSNSRCLFSVCVCVHAFSSHHFSHATGFPQESSGAIVFSYLSFIVLQGIEMDWACFQKRDMQILISCMAGFYTLSSRKPTSTTKQPAKTMSQNVLNMVWGFCQPQSLQCVCFLEVLVNYSIVSAYFGSILFWSKV